MGDRTNRQHKKADTATLSYLSLSSPIHSARKQSPDILPILQPSPQGHDISRISLIPQAKLTVSQPQDPYEQEADRVADRVMRMESHGLSEKSATHTQPIGIQRKCDTCGSEEDVVSRKGSNDINQEVNVSDSVGKVLQSGSAQSLDNTTRNFMESRFGYDFSQVRIHTNSNAVESTKTLNARAYTLGQDIVFGEGQYTPHTNQGRHLLAHELTHVVQQGKASTVKPKSKVQESHSNNILQQQGQKVQRHEDAIAVSNSPTSSVQRFPEWLNFSSDKCTSERWNCRAAWLTLAAVLAATAAALISASAATVGTGGLAAWLVPLTVIGGIVGAIASIAWGISAHKALSICLNNDPNADAAEKEQTRQRIEMLEKRLKDLESLKERDKQENQKTTQDSKAGGQVLQKEKPQFEF